MGPRFRLSVVIPLLAFAGLLLAACSDDAQSPTQPAVVAAAPTATQSSEQPPAAAPATSAATATLPNGERILADVRALADTIGPRPAGSERERQAADFIAEKLRGFGYEVSFQEFPIENDAARGATLSVGTPEQKTVPSVPFQGSGAGTVRARLVFAGLGAPEDFGGDTRGAVSLIERGDLTFASKVANATAAGARGVIIYNNEPGVIYGQLGEQAGVPAVFVSQTEGQALRSSLERGAVEAELSVQAPRTSISRNVIAKPPGRDCDTVSGGHYDSVSQAPGASDNATGTATVLELAGIIAAKGEMGGNCFVLFGAEEQGLVGSRVFVASMDRAARARLKAMLNFDMVGVGDEGWLLIGEAALQQRAQSLAATLGISAARSGRAPSGYGSDHASFLDAGIPAVFFHRTNDNLLHTPEDVSGRVKPEHLEDAARLGVAVLESLNAG